MPEDWNDPFAEDPAAKAREERRRAREERRRARLAKRVQKAATQSSDQSAEDHASPPAPPGTEEAEAVFPEERPADSEVAGAPPVEPRTPWQARRPPGPPRVASKRTYRRRRIAVFSVLLVLILAAIFAFLLFQPFHGSGHGKVVVTVPKSSSASDIADLLDQEGVVANSTLFGLRLRLSGKSGEIEAGKYNLKNDMSYGDAIDALTTPPTPVKPTTVTVTIPEGYDRTEIAKLVKQDGIRGDYLQASKSYRGFDPAKYGAKNPADLEGFLFPATYKIRPKQDVNDLVGMQLAAFEQNFKKVDMSYARSKNLTPYDVVTIASMIEKESADSADRPKVAAVIYNRLKQGIPLGIDSTIRFVLHDYTHPLTESELQMDSPYNTRTNAGLPPGPIANPGLASLQAAAHPAKVPYLYYVTRPGACGKLSFATTDAQFQNLVNKYNSAREAAGGKSPTSC